VVEWLCFCEDLLPRCAERALPLRTRKLLFLRSRMRVVDEADATKVTQLSFEDFLECLVRAVALLPLPTADELDSTNCENCFAFFRLLEATGKYDEFVSRRAPLGLPAVDGGEGPTAEQMATLPFRIEQTILHAINVVESSGKSSYEDGELTDKEVRAFLARQGSINKIKRAV